MSYNVIKYKDNINIHLLNMVNKFIKKKEDNSILYDY